MYNTPYFTIFTNETYKQNMIELNNAKKDIFARLENQIDFYVDKLEDEGILTETEIVASRVIISKFTLDFEDLFRTHGYTGGKLNSIGFEIENEGWMYAIYDTEKLDDNEVKCSLQANYLNIL